MTYLKRTNITEKRTRMTTTVISLFILGLFLIHYFFPGAYARVLYPVSTVFWNSESGILGFFANTARLVISKSSLIKENEKLNQEIARRDASTLLIETLKEENEKLKTTLGRTGKGNDILGVVLSRPPVSLYDTLIIDVGRTDGVDVGNNVYVDGDTLIGNIAEAYDHQSKVSLFSTPDREVSVLVGSSNVSAKAIGRGLGNFVITIPVEVGIEEGDVIVLPLIRPHTFGVVEKILVDSSDSLQTILFKSPVNINSLRFVEVDRNTN